MGTEITVTLSSFVGFGTDNNKKWLHRILQGTEGKVMNTYADHRSNSDRQLLLEGTVAKILYTGHIRNRMKISFAKY